jgi:hypothetical protein
MTGLVDVDRKACYFTFWTRISFIVLLAVL